jgi:predicted ATPase
MEKLNTNGSIWRKWDLHIHSNASDGKFTPEEIVDEAIKKGVSVIALTDHHTAKNIDKIKDYAKNKDITIISGIEFRTEYGSKSVHFIGLLPDKFNGIELNSKAIHDLILSKLEVSETKIIAKGKEDNQGLSDENAFKKGMFLVQVDFKKAADLIHQYGGLVSVHNGSKGNGLDDEMKHQGESVRNVKELYESLGTVKEELMKDYIDICEIRKADDSREFYLEKFNKPSIIASDAHELDEIGGKYVWIKADATFEGLKQIIYEPIDRVKIQENIPEEKNDYQVIDKIEITHDDFGSQSIPLNPYLNTIIGGRSSGKSLLLGSIAKKIGTAREVKKNNPEYENYIENEILPVLKIKWRDEIEDSTRNIEYFPQSFINGLAANSNDINSLIESTVKNEKEKKESIEAYVKYCRENKTKINSLVGILFKLYDELVEKEETIKQQGGNEGIKKQVDKIKEDIAIIKKSMNHEINEEEEKKYKDNIQILESYKESNNNISEAILKLKDLNTIEFTNSIEDDLYGLDDNLSKEVSDIYIKLEKEFRSVFLDAIDKIVIREGVVFQKNKSEIEKIRNSEKFIKCEEFFNKNETYVELVKKLKIEENKLKLIDDVEKEIVSVKKKIIKESEEIIKSHNNYYLEADELVRKLNFESGDVKILANPQFNNIEYYNILNARFNQRSNDVQNIVNYKYQNHDEFRNFLIGIFNKLIKEEITLKNSFDYQQVLIDIFSTNFYKINYDVRYQNDSLSSMSEGKKAFIILKILLDFSDEKCPILIDQPEDDLDNRAIYDQLVAYLRKKKKERQIILVTHNPNIVIGSDAEEIIVANQNGINSPNQDNIKFEYISGSLENSKELDETKSILIGQGIKQHVCELLEGGDEAFKQRERKYDIK